MVGLAAQLKRAIEALIRKYLRNALPVDSREPIRGSIGIGRGPDTDLADQEDLWEPEVYLVPASDNAPVGWGLPISPPLGTPLAGPFGYTDSRQYMLTEQPPTPPPVGLPALLRYQEETNVAINYWFDSVGSSEVVCAGGGKVFFRGEVVIDEGDRVYTAALYPDAPSRIHMLYWFARNTSLKKYFRHSAVVTISSVPPHIIVNSTSRTTVEVEHSAMADPDLIFEVFQSEFSPTVPDLGVCFRSSDPQASLKYWGIELTADGTKTEIDHVGDAFTYFVNDPYLYPDDPEFVHAMPPDGHPDLLPIDNDGAGKEAYYSAKLTRLIGMQYTAAGVLTSVWIEVYCAGAKAKSYYTVPDEVGLYIAYSSNERTTVKLLYDATVIKEWDQKIHMIRNQNVGASYPQVLTHETKNFFPIHISVRHDVTAWIEEPLATQGVSGPIEWVGDFKSYTDFGSIHRDHYAWDMSGADAELALNRGFSYFREDTNATAEHEDGYYAGFKWDIRTFVDTFVKMTGYARSSEDPDEELFYGYPRNWGVEHWGYEHQIRYGTYRAAATPGGNVIVGTSLNCRVTIPDPVNGIPEAFEIKHDLWCSGYDIKAVFEIDAEPNPRRAYESDIFLV